MKKYNPEWLFLAGLILGVLVASLITCCSSPVIQPVITSVHVDAPDTCLVILDGIEFGYGSMDLFMFENYPNYLQIGPWKFVLLSPVTFNTIQVE